MSYSTFVENDKFFYTFFIKNLIKLISFQVSSLHNMNKPANAQHQEEHQHQHSFDTISFVRSLLLY